MFIQKKNKIVNTTGLIGKIQMLPSFQIPNNRLKAHFFYNPHCCHKKKRATIIKKSKTRSKSENAFRFENLCFESQTCDQSSDYTASFAKSMLMPHPIITSVVAETTCACGSCSNTVRQNLAVNLFANFGIE